MTEDQLVTIGWYLLANSKSRFLKGYGQELIVFGDHLRPELVEREHNRFLHYMTGVEQ